MMKHSSGKRRFNELREIIMHRLAESQKTINQLSSETGINWKTVDNHLTYLAGKGLAREVFSSRFVRIFEITGKGLAALQGNDSGRRFEQKGEVRIG